MNLMVGVDDRGDHLLFVEAQVDQEIVAIAAQNFGALNVRAKIILFVIVIFHKIQCLRQSRAWNKYSSDPVMN